MARYLLSTAPVLALALLLLLVGRGREPRLATVEGNYAFARGDYVRATINYLGAGGAQVQPYVAYNVGNTYLALGEIDAGVERLRSITASTDRELLGRVAFNLGNAGYEAGRYLEAAHHFRDALLLAPESMDAKVNLELALRKVRTVPPRAGQDPAGAPGTSAQAVRILEFIHRREPASLPALPPPGDHAGY